MKTNGQCRYKYLMLGRDRSYFAKTYSDFDIINMLEFLIDTMFAMSGERVFHQTVCIPMGRNYAPLLADLFLYSYESNLELVNERLFI
jgi:hypothetical protein